MQQHLLLYVVVQYYFVFKSNFLKYIVIMYLKQSN